MTSDPLFDALFRPTSLSPAVASAAPVRQAGTRSRAGNAMDRTRAALLDGARAAVEVDGTHFTMSRVAAESGVAKATLYNHLRTRDAVLGALLQDEVAAVVSACAGRSLADALGTAATLLSEHRLVRALARIEPATLAALARVDLSAPGWRTGRAAVAELLHSHGRAGTDTVLRWLAGLLVTPAGPAAIAADLGVLLGGLPAAADARSA